MTTLNIVEGNLMQIEEHLWQRHYDNLNYNAKYLYSFKISECCCMEDEDGYVTYDCGVFDDPFELHQYEPDLEIERGPRDAW